jgi:hypothetical protein
MPLGVGVQVREIVTRDRQYQNCRVLHADATSLLFEVERTVSEGGTVETVVSQILVPWVNILYVVLMEERT